MWEWDVVLVLKWSTLGTRKKNDWFWDLDFFQQLVEIHECHSITEHNNRNEGSSMQPVRRKMMHCCLVRIACISLIPCRPFSGNCWFSGATCTTGCQLARLGRRSPRCSIFVAHPVDHGGLPLVSLRRIKILGAPVQSSREEVLFRGAFSERAEGPLWGITLSELEGRQPMWAIESQRISCP